MKELVANIVFYSNMSNYGLAQELKKMSEHYETESPEFLILLEAIHRLCPQVLEEEL